MRFPRFWAISSLLLSATLMAAPPILATQTLRPIAAEVPGGRPLALASADFDGDGFADVAAGFERAGKGVVLLLRANPQSRMGPVAKGQEPPPLTEAGVVDFPEPPELLAAGDFDNDGIADLVGAAVGSSGLVILRGRAEGGFADPELLALGGPATALATGEINRRDGIQDGRNAQKLTHPTLKN